MKPKVYLAGPISGCNPEQRSAWRDELKRGFHEEFDFIDPTDNLISPEGSDFEVVQADIDAIRTADAVLAYMWRESIGTAFGILHAHDASKIAVVCDPNYLSNRMAAFYADAVVRSLPAGLHAIRTFLAAQSQITEVVKADGSSEKFDRNKLSLSIRKACLDAGQSDIGPPRAIVASTLDKLIGDGLEPRSISTKEIREAVWEAMAELASDPSHEAEYDRIRQAWESFEARAETSSQPKMLFEPPPIHVTLHEHPLEVKIRKNGTHSTIWGHTIGAGAAPIFQEIKRVDGITEIVLGPFKNTGAPPVRPHVRLVASKTPYIIDGKCYDHGPKGTLQTFQIRVADASARDSVLDVLRTHLLNQGYVRPIA